MDSFHRWGGPGPLAKHVKENPAPYTSQFPAHHSPFVTFPCRNRAKTGGPEWPSKCSLELIPPQGVFGLFALFWAHESVSCCGSVSARTKGRKARRKTKQ